MLDLARVVASHPESNIVDLVMMVSGARLFGVQVMSGADAVLPRPAHRRRLKITAQAYLP